MRISDDQIIDVDDSKKVRRVKSIKEGTAIAKKEKPVKTVGDADVTVKEEKHVTKPSNERVHHEDFSSRAKSYATDRDKFKRILTIILIIFVAIVLFFSIKDLIPSRNADSDVINGSSSSSNVVGVSSGVSKVYNAVVYIENYRNNKLYTAGTGFIYKKTKSSAYILTNYHVVSSSNLLKVTLASDETVHATFVGGDEYLDIAVLRIDSKYVTQVVKFGSSKKTPIGSTVFTVGSPLNKQYRGTVTRGILSGKNRLVSVYDENTNKDYVMKLLQTDTAINSGNSGGPLCNQKGQVIGMISMKLVKDEIEGMGFAISVEDIKAHLRSYEKGSETTRPYLGIFVINASDTETLNRYNMRIPSDIGTGVVINSVVSTGSCYNKLQRGDVIIEFNGEKVSNIAYLRYELYRYKAKDKVTMLIDRDGKTKKVKIELIDKK